MIRAIASSLKLALTLTSVGIGVLLAASALGLIPTLEDVRLRHRLDMVETLTASVLEDVRQSRWVELEQTLDKVVARNEDLWSIGIRTRGGQVLVATSLHESLWAEHQHSQSQTGGSDPPRWRTSMQPPAVIQIANGGRDWGDIEFFFAPMADAQASWWSRPQTRMLMFFGLVALAANMFLVIRIFGFFQSTQMVPDHVRKALNTLAEGLLLLDGSGRIIFANAAFEMASNFDGSLEGKNASGLPWRDAELSPTSHLPWLQAVESGQAITGTTLRLATGTRTKIFSVNATPLQSKAAAKRSPRGVLTTFRDITYEHEHRQEQERMLKLLGESRDSIEAKNRRLEILATRDSLTGCLNRRAFFEKFDQLFSDSVVSNRKLSCLMIDIDHFKSVNDTYGHHTGDDVLRVVSATLREQFEASGLVCRYGGEEFCVLLPEIDIESAVQRAESTRQIITTLRLEEPAELRLTASLGVSELRFEPEDPQSLINQADACLYVAKREGRNRVITYNPTMSMQDDSSSNDNDGHVHIDVPLSTIAVINRALMLHAPATAERCRRIADVAAQMVEGWFDADLAYRLELSCLSHRFECFSPDHQVIDAEDWSWGKRRTLFDAAQSVVDSLGDNDVSKCVRDFQSIKLCEEMARYDAPTALPAHCHNFSRLDIATDGSPESDALALVLTVALHWEDTDRDLPISERLAGVRQACSPWVPANVIDRCLSAFEAEPSATTSGILALTRLLNTQLGAGLANIEQSIATGDLDQVVAKIDELLAFATSCGMENVREYASEIRGQLEGVDDWELIHHLIDGLINDCRSMQSEVLQFGLEQRAAGRPTLRSKES